MLQISKTCILLGTLLLGFAFPARAQTNDSPQVIVSVSVSVYDDAGVSAKTLAQAEQRAARIFASAGLDIVWQNCSSPSTKHAGPDALVRAGEQSSPVLEPELVGLRPAGRLRSPAPMWSGSDCGRFHWPTHLAVRVLPKSKHWTSDVFGVAFLSAEDTGCYSSVFYDRASELHSASNVDPSDILGNVIAHELGHLLLGCSSHVSSGIMRARWEEDELYRVARGSLLFTAEQSARMRAKVTAARAPLTVTARAIY